MVTLKIARFNPEKPEAAGWQSFRVPSLPSDRLLNLLHYVKWYLDGTLTFRRSCAHGVCGSDAMRINGVNRLACKVLMRDLLPKDPDGLRLTGAFDAWREALFALIAGIWPVWVSKKSDGVKNQRDKQKREPP